MRAILPLVSALILTISVAPASAHAATQDPTTVGDKVNFLIVYGNDPCPRSTGDEITVCARKSENERYRIPAALRDNPMDPRNQAWANRVAAYEYVGASGINSCSPSGAGGFLGCTQQLIDTAYAERHEGSDVQAGKLIAAARAERLKQIDAEAAATEADVEKIKAEQEARRAAAAREAATGTATTTPPPVDTSTTPPAH